MNTKVYRNTTMAVTVYTADRITCPRNIFFIVKPSIVCFGETEVSPKQHAHNYWAAVIT